MSDTNLRLEEEALLARILARRLKLRMTRSQCASALGIDWREYWRLETGGKRILAAAMPAIARVLRTTSGALYGEHEPRPVRRAKVASRRRAVKGRIRA